MKLTKAQFDFSKYKVIFFDFDGVIIESLEAKAAAFKSLYKPYGETVSNRVVKHHLEHGGMSRYKKIQYYHRAFLNKAITDHELTKLLKKFARITQKEVAKSKLTAGIINFLEEQNQKRPLFILSATPQNELISIVKTKKLASYFKAVIGTPTTKSEFIKEYMIQTNTKPNEAILIGDSNADFCAAKANGIDFLARRHQHNQNSFPKEINAIHDFT